MQENVGRRRWLWASNGNPIQALWLLAWFQLVNVFHKFLEMTRRTIPESTFWCAFQHDAMISHHPFIQSSSFRSELLSRSSKLNHAPISQTKQENRRNFCALSV